MTEIKESYKHFDIPTKYQDCIKEILSESEIELIKLNKASFTILHCVEYPFCEGIKELSILYKEIE